MSGINKKMEELLSIVIPTFNRARMLEQTLGYLKMSPVANCRITVLDNHSTDDTIKVCENSKFFLNHLDVVSHIVNLGGGCENLIHAIDYCKTEYLWILADDDTIDFSSFDDVAQKIIESSVDIIHVGAHDDGLWNWGVCDTPRNLVNKGYNYFKYSSFLPCSIFKFSYFVKYIKYAYDFIHYRYPHFPCLVSAYSNDVPIYVSKKRVVTATVGVQSYSYYIPFRGFVMASNFLKNNYDKRLICKSFFESRRMPFWGNVIKYLWRFRKENDIILVGFVLKKMMPFHEKVLWKLFYVPFAIKLFIK